VTLFSLSGLHQKTLCERVQSVAAESTTRNQYNVSIADPDGSVACNELRFRAADGGELTEAAAVYRDIWLHLNRTDLKPIPEHLAQGESGLMVSAALKYFADHTTAKIIDLQALTETDESYLASKRISSKHVIRNLEKTLHGRYLDARAFQLNAIRRKAVFAFCPFTGRLVESTHSFLANITVMFYRFVSEQVFYVVTAGIGSGFKKSALYFPEEELIVRTGHSWGFEEDDLIELKARMVSSAERCYEYLADDNRESKKTAVCVGFYHFAHHLWNELSGLHRLHAKGLVKSVDKFLVLREPLGDIGQIFSEIPGDKVERLDNTGDLFNHILENHYFAVRVGDDFVSSDLVSRVYSVALRNCFPETIERVREARGKHYPLFWVGIRVGNRTWDDQINGLSKLLSFMFAKFPNLGVVFDGFSLPADRSSQSSDQPDYSEIVGQENRIVKGVTERLQHRPEGLGLYNIIGSSIYDANVWAHAIDVYVSPYGTLQHKVGWLTSKPGIIHTNQTLSENPAKYVWAAIENVIKPRYLGCAHVRDVQRIEESGLAYYEVVDARESGAGVLATNRRVRTNPEFNNYVIESEALFDDLLALIQSPKMALRLAPSVVVNRVKRMLRKTLQGLTSSLDSSNI
jgi:hypothetical protein